MPTGTCKVTDGYSTLDQFIAHGCQDNPGNCAFCIYATTPQASQSWNQTCDGSKCQTKLNPKNEVYNQGAVVCFNNHVDPRDRLCIFTDYSTGKSNIDAWAPRERVANATVLIEEAQNDAVKRGDTLEGKTLCFHNQGAASVAWTHMHVFDKKLNPGGPEGICTTKTGYCTTYNDSTGVDGAANAISTKVGVKGLGCNDTTPSRTQR